MMEARFRDGTLDPALCLPAGGNRLNHAARERNVSSIVRRAGPDTAQEDQRADTLLP